MFLKCFWYYRGTSIERLQEDIKVTCSVLPACTHLLSWLMPIRKEVYIRAVHLVLSKYKLTKEKRLQSLILGTVLNYATLQQNRLEKKD